LAYDYCIYKEVKYEKQNSADYGNPLVGGNAGGDGMPIKIGGGRAG
jgi:hypothetical protein